MPAFTLNTNLAELPWAKTSQLSQQLNLNDQWKLLLDGSSAIYSFKPEQVDAISRQPNPSEAVLRELGNRGISVMQFMSHLHRLARVYGPVMDRPQLALGRKFAPVRITESVSVTAPASGLELEVKFKADGFPCPRFQWLHGDKELPDETSNVLRLSRCSCCIGAEPYQCRIRNEIDDDQEWSKNYRQDSKQYSSEKITAPLDLSTYQNTNSCDRCKQSEIERVYGNLSLSMANGDRASERNRDDGENAEDLVATDKVALIISNSEYEYLPRLLTPPCDAETLAQVLLELGFKTVTLADLTLVEMTRIIKEYRRLLGAGVYAVFYFVGHGFEANGQCYLLPVDSPGTGYRPSDCLSVDCVLSIMQEHEPALNLILLDVCRKYLPSEMNGFSVEAKRYEPKVKRNTVFGYATSCGVGAYEVRGDTNGVFMKYLKNHLTLQRPVTDVISRVLRDLEDDPKASEAQYPELRFNLSKPRSLTDPLVYAGHTVSFEHHTIEWQHIHELPEPVRVSFEELNLRATVWFDYCGHFTNMVYVFCSIGDHRSADDDNDDPPVSTFALAHRAYVKFAPPLETVHTSICADDEEGESVRSLLKNLQKSNGPISCRIEVQNKETSVVVGETDVVLGHVLVTKIFRE
uniref:Caspase family p20 domain-containing protein n=1 Tax=Plectus sambesii TaxID=2011161 RepID=A0A914V892_9BILA